MTELTNADRAQYGQNAVNAGTPDIGQNDAHTDLTDTLSNLLHLAAQAGLDFDAALGTARFHTESEIDEETGEMFECNGCGNVEPLTQTLEAEKLSMRLDYGSPYTDRECSSCGALTFKVKEAE